MNDANVFKNITVLSLEQATVLPYLTLRLAEDGANVAEDVPHDKVKGRCDFAFTSPPYFSKEHYSQDIHRVGSVTRQATHGGTAFYFH